MFHVFQLECGPAHFEANLSDVSSSLSVCLWLSRACMRDFIMTTELFDWQRETLWLSRPVHATSSSGSTPAASFQPPSIRFWKTLNKLMTIDGWLILHQQQLIGDNIKWRLPLPIRAAIWRVCAQRRGGAKQPATVDDKYAGFVGPAVCNALTLWLTVHLIREQQPRLWRQTLGVNVQLKYSTLSSPGGAPTVPGFIKFSSASLWKREMLRRGGGGRKNKTEGVIMTKGNRAAPSCFVESSQYCMVVFFLEPMLYYLKKYSIYIAASAFIKCFKIEKSWCGFLFLVLGSHWFALTINK